MFASEDSRRPFTQYLTEGIPPQKHNERYKLKRLATRYFLHNTVLFKKEYDGDPLRCLGPKEVREMIKEVHSGEYGEHQRKEKALQMPVANGLPLAYHEERCGIICKKMP